ncbi:hypothetical protein SAMN02745117_00434 [Lampropedia hyalina DSM 16112]|jgi:predicted alpha/beta superfamily hydrolase|uniref:Esterase n=1 Tax=Lampropedia hyalina DSM 16112 TaxID=1122156 RepID=A0A1M4U4V6_9BURK|nr:alpha/beta hydrolase-fold protein [Lampropedia hyalina]SHE51715.1 hypothetical protein SAMN02745117_00434 [Lampropedia hyalina DSM 16112]
MTHLDLSKRRIALLGLSALAWSSTVRAQAAPAEPTRSSQAQPRRANQMPAEIIEHERVESFKLGGSADGHEPWLIHLARPRGKEPAAGYPVLYLLDGNASFPAAWHALSALHVERPELADALDALVLVGVGYPSGLRIDTPGRYRDFTPYTAEEFRRARGVELVTGGRQVFLEFLTQPLREAVATRLRTDPRRQSLFGHSLGGLFTLHTLFNRPALFQNYVAGDPSLWWNGASALQEQAAFIAGVRAAGGRLTSPIRLLVAHSGPPRNGDTTPSTPSAELAHIGNLQMWHRQIEEASHGAMFGPAAKDAVLFALGQLPSGARRL